MRTLPRSPRSRAALDLVVTLQRRFVDALRAHGPFVPVEWLRDAGRHGGGLRFEAAPGPFYDRASVNVSAVHYDDLPDRALGGANALSAIVHPDDPRQPSIHLHVSYTELRNGTGAWRIMADLNPSVPDAADRGAFLAALQAAAPEHWEAAAAQGDRYFFIPALGRHRGVAHFYLEGHDSGDLAADAALAQRIGEAAIDTYAALLDRPRVGEPDRAAQRAYHTTYLFQVLTLDRGTTSGLLVHDQNDVGILGSLPAQIDTDLLASWRNRVPEVQRPLVDALVACIPAGRVDEAAKRALARAVRAFYAAHPEALAFQASGDVIPTTVANHR